MVCFVAKTEKLTTNKKPPKRHSPTSSVSLLGTDPSRVQCELKITQKILGKLKLISVSTIPKKNKQNLFRRKQPQNYFEQAKEDCAVFLAFYSNGESSTSGSRAPFPQHFFKIMQFSGNFKGPPHFEQLLGSGPPLGVKTLLDHSLIFVPNVT